MGSILIAWDVQPRDLAADPAAAIARDRAGWEATGARFAEYEDEIGGTSALATATIHLDGSATTFGILDFGADTTYLLVEGSFRDHAALAARLLAALEESSILSAGEVVERLPTKPVDTVDEPLLAGDKLGSSVPVWNPISVSGGPRGSLTIGDIAPDFEAETGEGRVSFHGWIGDSWVVLFSKPWAITPVVTTELGYMASIEQEFGKRAVKVIALAVGASDRSSRSARPEEITGQSPGYPVIADSEMIVARRYGMLPAVPDDPAHPLTGDHTTRNVFIIGPDKKIKLLLVYPMTTGRNFDEVLRVIDSLQLTAKHKVATPAQWQPGDDVIMDGSTDDAKKMSEDWESPRPYIRLVPQPGGSGR